MHPFYAVKNRGQYQGELLFPHRHSDGNYVATTSKYSADYIRVGSLDELTALVRAGYGARMSNPGIPQAQSYISHERIKFAAEEEPLTQLKEFLASFVEDGELDSETVANRRKEQAFLQSYLLQGEIHGVCTLCGRTLPQELLVAAHIKARSECNRNEKLDLDNVAALMCVLGCDSLFDKGFVYAPNGSIQANPRRKGTQHLNDAIDQLVGRTIANWSKSSAYYLWHAKEFGWKCE